MGCKAVRGCGMGGAGAPSGLHSVPEGKEPFISRGQRAAGSGAHPSRLTLRPALPRRPSLAVSARERSTRPVLCARPPPTPGQEVMDRLTSPLCHPAQPQLLPSALTPRLGPLAARLPSQPLQATPRLC